MVNPPNGDGLDQCPRGLFYITAAMDDKLCLSKMPDQTGVKSHFESLIAWGDRERVCFRHASPGVGITTQS
jgi:hypothetical protein